MNFWEKIETNNYSELAWNIPERKQGRLNVVGGSAQNFRTEIRVTEFLINRYPIAQLNTVLPDALKDTVPPAEGVIFLSSTESGSFANEKELQKIFSAGDFSLLVGDCSKNQITAQAISKACENAERPLIITRDAADLIATSNLEKTFLNENLMFFITTPQLQKLFRAVFYPKMITLSMPMTQIAEAIHKFTLSYRVGLIVLNNGQLLIAKNGAVKVVPIEKTSYTPLTLWNGEAAAKIAVFNLYNPNNFIPATICALMETTA